MAYSIPTVAATTVAPSIPPASATTTATVGVPFKMKLYITSTGTIGVKIRSVRCSQISGPSVVFGNPDIREGTSTEYTGTSVVPAVIVAGTQLPIGVGKAGTYPPATNGVGSDTTDWVPNAGSTAYTTLWVPLLATASGTAVLKFIVDITRDDDDTRVQVICADKSVTVQALA
jgi:hypothetical protein